MTLSVDPAVIAAWLTARSIGRGLPLPVADRGGLRVDTNSPAEIRRWVFPHIVPELAELAGEIRAPGYFIKACVADERLSAIVPACWRIQPARYVMTSLEPPPAEVDTPEGYSVERQRNGPVTHVRITTGEGDLAASGFAAETDDAFIYDRIETAASHRRRGLARTVMFSLGVARTSPSTRQILVATEDGRQLYASLGWSIYAPYATATIPA